MVYSGDKQPTILRRRCQSGNESRTDHASYENEISYKFCMLPMLHSPQSLNATPRATEQRSLPSPGPRTNETTKHRASTTLRRRRSWACCSGWREAPARSGSVRRGAPRSFRRSTSSRSKQIVRGGNNIGRVCRAMHDVYFVCDPEGTLELLQITNTIKVGQKRASYFLSCEGGPLRKDVRGWDKRLL